MLTIATQYNWPIHQIDVNNAFLQGSLEEEVYLRQPPGFKDQSLSTHVCKLNKAIYGLNQAPRAWYNVLKSYLLTVGFVKSQSDSSLFILHNFRFIVYVPIYVDDITITGNQICGVLHIIDGLSTRFSLKDLGQVDYFLGVEVISSTAGPFLSQH